MSTGYADLSLEDFAHLSTESYASADTLGDGSGDSLAALFKPVWVASSDLSNLERVAGQFVVETDTGNSYVDTNSSRVQLTDATRLAKNQGSTNSGKYLTINSSGDVIATNFPVASTSVVGGVKIDGTIISVDNSNQLQISKNALVAGTGTGSIAIGTGAAANNNQDIAIGQDASATALSLQGGTIQYTPSLAIGYGAVASSGSIQIGYGTNNANGTLSVGYIIKSSFGDVPHNYRLLDANGIIPKDRLPTATTNNIGAVKVDGSSITITDGTIQAADQLASFKQKRYAGKYFIIDEDGDIDVTSLPTYGGETSIVYNGEVE